MDEPEHKSLEREMMLHGSSMARWALLSVGTISLVLGIIGIVLPLVPTTPFLLVSAACFARSSRRFYFWLMTNRWFGRYVRDWRNGLGIPLSGKIGSTVMLVVTLGTSIVMFVPIDAVRIALAAVGLAVIAYIWRQPTRR